MRKLRITACSIWMLFACPVGIYAASPFAFHQPDQRPAPPYAKWGVFAMNAVKNKYHVEIVDYLHVGRKVITPKITQETFKFWVREPNQLEYAIYVVIKFDTQTEKVIDVQFMRTNH